VLTLLCRSPDSPDDSKGLPPGNTSYEMPSTAWTSPSSVRNSTTRSRIERTGSGTNPPLLAGRGASRSPSPMKVDAEDDGDDRQAGEHGQPPFFWGLFLAGTATRNAERRGRRLDAEAEEGKRPPRSGSR